MAREKITDHSVAAVDRLPKHAAAGTNYVSLIDLIGDRAQLIEDELFKLLTERSLDVAVGAQLDGLGEILDLAREVGQNDASYRTALQGRANELAQSGEPEVIIEAALQLSGGTSVQLLETGVATMTVAIFGGTLDADGKTALRAVKAGGVRLDIVESPDNPFVFAGDPDGEGFGAIGYTEGGEFVGAI